MNPVSRPHYQIWYQVSTSVSHLVEVADRLRPGRVLHLNESRRVGDTFGAVDAARLLSRLLGCTWGQTGHFVSRRRVMLYSCRATVPRDHMIRFTTRAPRPTNSQ